MNDIDVVRKRIELVTRNKMIFSFQKFFLFFLQNLQKNKLYCKISLCDRTNMQIEHKKSNANEYFYMDYIFTVVTYLMSFSKEIYVLKSIQLKDGGRIVLPSGSLSSNRGNKRGNHPRYFVNLFSCHSTSSYWFFAINNKNNNNSESRYRSRDDLPFYYLGSRVIAFVSTSSSVPSNL